jgi:hypothetical protein
MTTIHLIWYIYLACGLGKYFLNYLFFGHAAKRGHSASQ